MITGKRERTRRQREVGGLVLILPVEPSAIDGHTNAVFHVSPEGDALTWRSDNGSASFTIVGIHHEEVIRALVRGDAALRFCICVKTRVGVKVIGRDIRKHGDMR